jgi:SRSO17 transposase
MSLLDHAQAQSLLNDATVTADTVRNCADSLTNFLQRYLPKFYRVEQRENAGRVIRGLLSGLERKTCEPIAREAGRPRKPIQSFVGAGKWDDEAVMKELRDHVCTALGDPEGVVVIDPSAFPKKGTESCGVDRQWCGRLGKVDNCQVGVFLAYATTAGYAPLDRRLYLPKEWAGDRARRKKCHVPAKVRFQEKWQIALELLDRSLVGLPHGWITGDDELGRATKFRAELRRRGERYVLDVPCNTLVRDLEQPPPPRQSSRGREPKTPFRRVDAWAKDQPPSRWERQTIRDAEKGPLEVEMLSGWVQTKEDGRVGPEERLVVIRPIGESRTDYAVSNADREVPLIAVGRAQRQRHRIEEMFAAGNGEAGLDHYEVRSWVGWHHHMTLAFVALWYLCLERRRVGGENPGHHGVPNETDHHVPTPSSSANARGDRRGGLSRVAA